MKDKQDKYNAKLSDIEIVLEAQRAVHEEIRLRKERQYQLQVEARKDNSFIGELYF